MTASTGATLPDILNSITAASSESDVEQKVVIPLLSLLGYSERDWHPQFVIGNSRLDFLVCPKDAAISYLPYLAIEVKSPSKKIAQSGWQISKYMRKSGAVLGLLTNGYFFRIFYNYKGKITTILEYEQLALIENHILFHKLLCKTTSISFYQALYHSEQQMRLKFAKAISNTFGIENMLGLFKRNKASPQETKESLVSDATVEQSLLSELKEERKSMIITVFNNKGGVGKTTMTINLAAALNELGKRVLLIDIDGQANLTTGLGIDPLIDVEDTGKKDITHLLTEPRTKLEETIIKKRWGQIELDLVPSHIRLSRMENTLNTTIDIDRVLESKLRNHNYDFVFIDPPPSFGRVNGISLMASSAILIPTQLSAYPIRALEYVLDRIDEVQLLKPLPILGIAVSMYDQRSSMFNLSMTERLFDVLKRKGWSNKVELFPESTWIPRLNILSVSQDKGYPLYQAEFDDELTYQDKEAAQKALERYTELAEYLIKITQKESENNG